jgi:hypothetical protein
MKEILQAIKEMQKDPDDIKGGETSLIIPSLERLVNVSYFFMFMSILNHSSPPLKIRDNVLLHTGLHGF